MQYEICVEQLTKVCRELKKEIDSIEVEVARMGITRNSLIEQLKEVEKLYMIINSGKLESEKPINEDLNPVSENCC